MTRVLVGMELRYVSEGTEQDFSKTSLPSWDGNEARTGRDAAEHRKGKGISLKNISAGSY